MNRTLDGVIFMSAKRSLPVVVNKYHLSAAQLNECVDITRNGKFGNKHPITATHDRAMVCEMHRADLHSDPAMMLEVRSTFPGKHLACVCAPRQCHGDNYVELCAMPTARFDALLKLARRKTAGL
jgi:uncharacterized protein DUF4326